MGVLELRVDTGGPLPESVDVSGYYVVAEALTNPQLAERQLISRLGQVRARAAVVPAHL